MKLKLNHSMLWHKKGDIIEVKEIDGQPSDLYWRRRIKDAKIDNCVEIVSELPKHEKKELKEIKSEIKSEKKEVKNDSN